MSNKPPRQAPLPFAHGEGLVTPFVASAQTRAATDAIAAWLDHLRLAPDSAASAIPARGLTGFPGVGKSTLLATILRAHNGHLLRHDEEGPEGAPLLALDDAESADPLVLFAHLNRAMRRGQPLILCGRGAMISWAERAETGRMDLTSRLTAIGETSLDPPEEADLARALAAILAANGHRYDFALFERTAKQLKRRYSAVVAVAQSVLALHLEHAAPKALLAAALADNPDQCLG